MNCSICLDELHIPIPYDDEIDTDISDRTPLLFNKTVNDTHTIKTLSCGHQFHNGCIDEWLHSNNSCPYCRIIVKNKLDVTITFETTRLFSFNSKYKAIIHFPSNYHNMRTFDIIIYFKNTSKANIVLNTFSVKEFRHIKNSIKLRYFVRYPDILENLIIIFKPNEAQYLVDLILYNFNNQITTHNITDSIIESDEMVQNFIE